jgi:hypothetical protein
MFCSTLTAWNCVAFHGKSVSGSLVTPTTREPPAAPVSSVSDGSGAVHPVMVSATAAAMLNAPRPARRARVPPCIVNSSGLVMPSSGRDWCCGAGWSSIVDRV